MTRSLPHARLDVRLIQTPEDDWRERVQAILHHKGAPWENHIADAFADGCGRLETRFYLAVEGETPIANIMTVERDGVGLFGHVFTRLDHRRKGIMSELMGVQMADFRARGGKVLLLGTGYASTAYRIYASHSFRDWPGRADGLMRYDDPDAPDFVARHFGDASAGGAVVRAEWEHWPLVSLLATVPTGVRLRHLAFGVWGTGLLEGPYCGFVVERARRGDSEASVLLSPSGAVTALASVTLDRVWQRIPQLDLLAHPEAPVDALARLVAGVPLPAGPVHAWADPADTQKHGALESNGFTRTAVVPGRIRDGDGFRDAWLYARS